MKILVSAANGLTVYSLILKNTLVSLFKVRRTPQFVPHAIRQLLSDTDPDDMTHNAQRLTTQINTIFIKGIRLFLEIVDECKGRDTPLPMDKLSTFKSHLFLYLLEQQSLGNEEEWVYDNFRLCNQLATRQSARVKMKQSSQEKICKIINKSCLVYYILFSVLTVL